MKTTRDGYTKYTILDRIANWWPLVLLVLAVALCVIVFGSSS